MASSGRGSSDEPSVAPGNAGSNLPPESALRNQKFADSPLEQAGFELSVSTWDDGAFSRSEAEGEKPVRVDRKNWYVLEVKPRVRIRLAAAQSQAIRSTMYFGPRCWSGRPGINRGGLADDCRFRIGGAGTRSGAFVSESKSRTSRVVDRGGRGYSRT